MMIAPKVKWSRVVENTWRSFLTDFLTCVGAYLADKHLFVHYIDFPPLIPTILGTALAFFIGFNNNQAYDRWWEARKVWGEIVNDSRSWARQIIHFLKPNGGDPLFVNTLKERMVKRHIAFLYALKSNLRKSDRTQYKEYLSEEEVAEIESQSNLHNAILHIQTKDLQDAYDNGYIDGFQFLELSKLLVRFSDEMGKSERIKNTVFPTPYYYYTKVFTWIFIISVTIVTADYVDMWSIAFGTMIGYVFLTTQFIGQTLVNPFDEIPTSIPLNQITRTIEINLLEMLGYKKTPAPIEPVDDEYIM